MQDFDFILVMTAAVNPNGMANLSAESLDNREQQYIDTLNFYASQLEIKKILFVENSNWDLTHIKASVSNQEKISWMSLDENNFPREWGKGYGEFLLMDRAVESLEKTTTKDGLIVKVTGRFPVLNIGAMLREFQRRKPLALAIDVIDHPFFDWLHLGWDAHHARTIIYALTLGFYNAHIKGRYKEIPSKFYGAENLMYDVVRQTKALPGVYWRFKREPRLSGVGGIGRAHMGLLTAADYDSFLARIKRGVRQFCRTFFPFIKL